MLNNNAIEIKKPTDPKQLVHLIDMNGFFGTRIEDEAIDEASMLNYQYGVECTNDFNEFCDAMHTALYWLDETYSDSFLVEKAGEALNLCSKIDDLDEDMYRVDIIFGTWLSFVVCDTPKMREDFLGELSGMTEQEFIDKLYEHSNNLLLVETFTTKWIKKMIDPARAAAYGHYMLYLMMKVAYMMHEDRAVMSQVMSDLFIFTHAASRLYIMEQHNMPLN